MDSGVGDAREADDLRAQGHARARVHQRGERPPAGRPLRRDLDDPVVVRRQPRRLQVEEHHAPRLPSPRFERRLGRRFERRPGAGGRDAAGGRRCGGLPGQQRPHTPHHARPLGGVEVRVGLGLVEQADRGRHLVLPPRRGAALPQQRPELECGTVSTARRTVQGTGEGPEAHLRHEEEVEGLEVPPAGVREAAPLLERQRPAELRRVQLQPGGGGVRLLRQSGVPRLATGPVRGRRRARGVGCPAGRGGQGPGPGRGRGEAAGDRPGAEEVQGPPEALGGQRRGPQARGRGGPPEHPGPQRREGALHPGAAPPLLQPEVPGHPFRGGREWGP